MIEFKSFNPKKSSPKMEKIKTKKNVEKTWNKLH